MRRRVVVTGLAGLSPLGSDWATIRAGLLAGRSGVRVMPEWDGYDGLDTRLGAPVRDFSVPSHYARKKVRSMGRVALLATRATELALAEAGLTDSTFVTDGTTGISYGSTGVSPPGPPPCRRPRRRCRPPPTPTSPYAKRMIRQAIIFSFTTSGISWMRSTTR